MVGSRAATPIRWIVIAFVIAAFFLLQLAVAASARAAECTDTWTGPAEGSWATSANWSAGHVPTTTDVACIGTGKAAVSSETSVAAAVQGEGGVVVSAGSLEIVGGTEASSIKTLGLTGGALEGAGAVAISGSFTWSGPGALEGPGTTRIPPGASASMSGSGARSLKARRLLNEGTFTESGSNVTLSEGAEIVNRGTYLANSVASPNIGSSGSASFVNEGRFARTVGANPVGVAVPFVNEGTVEASVGTLQFRSGGTSGTAAEWIAASGATVELEQGAYTLKGSLSGKTSVGSAAVKLEGASFASTSQVSISSGSLEVSSGVEEVASLTLSGNGALKGAGAVAISGSFTWSGPGALEGPGTTRIPPGASASITSTMEVHLKGGRFVNEGTVTQTAGMHLRNGAELINSGTYNANAPGSPLVNTEDETGRITNTGVFQRTAGLSGDHTVNVSFVNNGAINNVVGRLTFPKAVTIAASEGSPHHACHGDPVDCATGSFTETQTDLEIDGRGVGLDLTRTYSAQAAKAEKLGIFGYGWTNSFGDKLTAEGGGAEQTLTEASGGTVAFTKSGAAWLAPSWSQDALTGSAEAGFTLTLPNQTKEKFNGSGRLESVTDRNGNEATLAYNGSGKLETITDPTGRKITLTYNGEGLVEKAKDPMGHEVKYAYEGKTLKSVMPPGAASPAGSSNTTPRGG